MASEYTQNALNLLDEYFSLRTTYALHLKNGTVTEEVEDPYLKVEQEILELMGAE